MRSRVPVWGLAGGWGNAYYPGKMLTCKLCDRKSVESLTSFMIQEATSQTEAELAQQL